MVYEIYHKTTYTYHGLVTFSHNIARIEPRNTSYQEVLDFSMSVEPQLCESYAFTDMFGNANVHMLMRQAHNSLVVEATSKVKLNLEAIEAHHKILQASSITYEEALKRLAAFHPDDIEAKAFLYESELIPTSSKKIKKYALEIFEPKRTLYEAGVMLMQKIYNEFEFVSGFSDVTTPVETIFSAKKGVCQDFAQFAIAALRSIGLCAKYMSGYIETIPPEGEKKLFGVDASHAWLALYIPGSGWLELDPTNNVIPKEQHILLGSGRDYYDIAPLKGVVMSSGGSGLSVVVDVRREAEIKTPLQSQSQFQSQW